MFQYRILILIFICLTGCAGPMSPFGAINQDDKPTLEEFTSGRKTEAQGLSVIFTPDRQVLHSKSKLEITINSSDKIQESHLFKIYYNSKDVTDAYLKRSEKNILSDSNQIEMAFKNLRLPASRNHNIVIAFQPSKDSNLILAKYLPPTCLETDDMDIISTGLFTPPSEYLLWIKSSSKVKELNPSLLAGLIAQESGFNESSVSFAKAIGLTQITSSAESEIIPLRPNWPRYSKISDLSAPQIKTLIASKKITSENEWRLDPKKSIDGGSLYLKYLSEYWKKPENSDLVKANFKDVDLAMTTVVLASYNSGAARVKRALNEHGKDFLYDDELGEARKYVNRIMSYCYHFSKKES